MNVTAISETVTASLPVDWQEPTRGWFGWRVKIKTGKIMETTNKDATGQPVASSVPETPSKRQKFTGVKISNSNRVAKVKRSDISTFAFAVNTPYAGFSELIKDNIASLKAVKVTDEIAAGLLASGCSETLVAKLKKNGITPQFVVGTLYLQVEDADRTAD